MTHDEIDQLEAGPELDALVESIVFGRVPLKIDGCRIGICYSTDIAAAWEVVERIVADGWICHLVGDNEGWVCELSHEDSRRADDGGPTAPLAICRAALKAKEVNDE